jgi:hypothetical protein
MACLFVKLAKLLMAAGRWRMVATMRRLDGNTLTGGRGEIPR